ncbi:uncharacterized protein EAE98_009744 [Botrytis deweyae]|uniref:Fungal N-terminal domain-containing protein n=1 Tax=Botrytis deweyae TaxID=2478750 RepID=A0ABQ7IB29_9HELO|nr:uncharacterized protein EAE98_009744 [Botrytis deweyae]KAF7918501.1 hypothetical protein EAE98_009744 [Botrytis deweyae]
MADVLGTAAGVVSPGLQVSQGIVSYYSAYRDQADEIDGIAQRTQALHTTLKGLQASLGSLHSNHTSAITLVAATVASCADNIRTFETTLQKCQLSVPIGTREKNCSLGKKAIFPFRQATLQRLENIVCKLQANVDMAIMALQLSRSLNQYMVPELSNVRMALQDVPEIVEQATPRALNLNQKQLAATVDNTSSKALIPDSDDRAFETSIRKVAKNRCLSDPCTCAFSKSGCTALTILLKQTTLELDEEEIISVFTDLSEEGYRS